MLSLISTGSPLKELALEPSRGKGHIPLRAFQPTFWNPFSLPKIVQNLTKLRLILSIDSFPLDSLNRCAYVGGYVARTLAAATGLESFFINFHWANDGDDDLGMTNFESILGGCQFPRLKSLILASFDSTAEELIRFFKTSKAL